MIPKEKVDQIFDTVEIEEVIGDFVNLKKRGANFIGLCPFHDEKTPSFTVSPAKQIYKCFGCGKAGNAATFLMEHEHYSYPEALKFLANKYGIEIEEEELSDDQKEARNDRESILIVLNKAKDFYIDYLFQSQAGKEIALSYLKERNIDEVSIKNFEIGFSPAEKSAFSNYGEKIGIAKEYLLKAGLSVETKEGHLIDRFRERIIFPIHSISGRVLGFGGRILRKNTKEAKYINTPETEVYNKSKILYGLFQAKQEIRRKEACILVEGYTDVISLHQSGIQNVVASSGTSLTIDQVKLIKRYAENVLFLFDADPAGVKAALRGVDIVLEHDLNVKIIILPEGDDPDTFSRDRDTEEIELFLKENAEDFIRFKTKILKEEYGNDPVQKVRIIKGVVESISKIPDKLKRSIYVKETSRSLDVSEELLYQELNQFIIERVHKERNERKRDAKPPSPERKPPEQPGSDYDEGQNLTGIGAGRQEREIIKLLVLFGDREYEPEGDAGEDEQTEMNVASYILSETDEMDWDNEQYKSIRDLYQERILEDEPVPNLQWFINHENSDFQKMAAEFAAEKHHLSENWKEHIGKEVVPPEHNYKKAIQSAMAHLKLKKVMQLIKVNQEELKNADSEEKVEELLHIKHHLNDLKQNLSDSLGAVVLE